MTEYQKINSAQSILIVGGGPTGVELAGEIAVDFPDKKVTLVHSGSRLLEFIGPKAAEKTAMMVDIKESQADTRAKSLWTPLGSAWLKETILKDNLDNHRRVKVDEYLRVKGRKNIFAIGDISDIPELKQGYLAKEQAQVAAKNLKWWKRMQNGNL
ncbi:putative Apoptosis-inducing factor [Quillaja saponaria]|uniref:Apoptosis-inducing factor n=1 Tax=Quillaja saponaria TaxID=32244 RepID=A0AAD7KY11_QUISA|nr:putative Apoptosis-inducing factor [Quillaja saponaria]